MLAAGKGTRMKSARAKVLHAAHGLPLLEHVLRAVSQLGASPLSVVVGHQAESVEAAFAGRDLAFVRQDPPLGTGHAVQAARGVFSRTPERTLLVLSGDVPLLGAQTLTRLLETHEAQGAAATLLTVSLPDAGAYGRVLRDDAGHVAAIVEAKDATDKERAVREINAGIYAFEVPALLEVLSLLRPQNAQGEYYLTDVIGLLRGRGHRVAALCAEDPAEAMGVNTLAELAEISRLLSARRLAELMRQGVVVEDPGSTHVGLDATVEPEAVLRAFTLVEGRSTVRGGAMVGPWVRLVDAEVGRGAQVLDHCLLRECVVEEGASIGPFAHIRPESWVGPGAKVGNFVELKKTRLGAGAKAPHLSYIGDATVGAKANIGAGTITCNYDGTHKHPTTIGERAFVGSNSTLVAPVVIGEGSYVAAGSAITGDVPPGALAVGRSRQVVKPGWVEERTRNRPRKEQAALPGGAPLVTRKD